MCKEKTKSRGLRSKIAIIDDWISWDLSLGDDIVLEFKNGEYIKCHDSKRSKEKD